MRLTSGRPALATTSRRTVLVRADKGFKSKPSKSGGQQPKKVSKRGKVASRPDPKKQLEQLKADEEQYQAQFNQKLETTPIREIGGISKPSSISSFSNSAPTSNNLREEFSTDTVPTTITDRMLKRILIFAGAPITVGLLLYPAFYYLKVKQNIDFDNWIVVLVQSLTFGAGLLGISYGIMSSSWDERREGSFLGVDEFKTNLPLVKERFSKKEY